MIKIEGNFKYKLIYIFKIDDAAHKGILKIGDATLKTNIPVKNFPPNCKDLNNAAKKRINKYMNTGGIKFELVYTEIAVTYKGKTFRDYDVHQVLLRSGFNKKKPNGTTAQEWFKVDIENAIKAILAVKRGEKTIYFDDKKFSSAEIFLPITFRPEQLDAIKETVKIFKKENRMLWNAKMRFGKTLCALEVVKRLQIPKTLIITHRPVVNENWYEDFKKIFHDTNFAYGSKTTGETIENLLRGNKNFVYFASMQDLRGSEITGGNFDKNSEIFGAAWDLVIVDEAHEGTKTVLGETVIKNLVKEKTKLLALSGTPFNILEDYEGNVFTWDYIDEQRAKNDWYKVHGLDSNPYEDLPEMKIFTYNLGEIFNNPAFIDDDKFFNFKEFFRTDNEKFVHENFVKQFLELLTRTDKNSNYPYSTEEYRNIFRHSLWIIPGVKEGRALSKLLKSHWIFRNFEIVNVAGDGDADEESKDALQKVRNAVDNHEYTITLSCGKLTTGVTVPEWSAIFMLAGGYSTSAASYMQTIFRVQSPCNKGGKVKDICCVFDFAPDRTLKIIAEYNTITGGGNRQQLEEFLNFCPVIAIQGSKMIEYHAPALFQQVKRVQAERIVKHGFDDSNLYNQKLLQLDNIEIEKFNNLKGIIGASKAQKKTNEIDINAEGVKGGGKTSTGGGSPKNPELEKARRIRRDAISILRGISIRMPLLIYGADIDFEQDFTIEMFFDDKIIDAASWAEFMPKGVTKEIFSEFIKYYDEDVFIAAGKKIRALAKSADTLTPTARVKKIAELFSCFKNPDKETVLTPWRVVNLHLSLTFGGFDFFDDNHENILDAPRRVNVENSVLANPLAQILEINSKTGLYPLYVAYSIYRARLGKLDESKFELHTLQHLWDKTLSENIFVICKTPMAKTITRRTLAGFRHQNINAEYFDDLINCLKISPQIFIDCITQKSFWNKGAGTMKFDAVVGNPPYQVAQEGDNETFATPIYQEFLKATFRLQTKVSLIHPARFLFNAGATSKDFNQKFLQNKHVKIVHYTPKSWELFPNTDIKGGVAVTYYDPEENFEPIKIFIPFPELKSIHKKVVLDNENFSPLSEIMVGQMTYKLSPKAYEDFPDLPKRLPKRTDTALRTNAFEIMPDIFLDEKPNDGNEYFQIIGNDRIYKFVRRDYMIDIPQFHTYKVFIPAANGSGAIGEKLSTPLVGLPLVGCTQTFITLGAFTTCTEAGNALKFVKTKFARALLGVLKVTQHNPPATWACVPMQDFTDNSDIDWSRSVHRIDIQLYRKYKLSPEEIIFIEEKVKDM